MEGSEIYWMWSSEEGLRWGNSSRRHTNSRKRQTDSAYRADWEERFMEVNLPYTSNFYIRQQLKPGRLQGETMM